MTYILSCSLTNFDKNGASKLTCVYDVHDTAIRFLYAQINTSGVSEISIHYQIFNISSLLLRLTCLTFNISK